jgi:hypothetical protein
MPWHTGGLRAAFIWEDFMNTWKLLGGLAMATFVAGLLMNLRDIRRYVRITTM